MKLLIMSACFSALIAPAANAASVCLLSGSIYGARQSCDGARYTDVSLSGALQTLLSQGYQIHSVVADAGNAGSLNYLLIK